MSGQEIKARLMVFGKIQEAAIKAAEERKKARRVNKTRRRSSG